MLILTPNLKAHLLPRKADETRHESQLRNLHHAHTTTGYFSKGRGAAIEGVRAARYLRWHQHAERWLQRELSEDWYGSVELVRYYIGEPEADWLWSCSTSEGGHGGFVWNRQGSGAGGNLQFLRSTWNRMFPSGLTIVRKYGVYVPGFARSYYHPLGQAVAGVYGYRYSRGEWVGAGC